MITIKQARWRTPVIYSLVLTLAILGAALLTVKLTQTSDAASGKDFNPGRIIDDAVFYNSNAMETTQIQQFLNSKVPTCDTNGQQLSEFGGPDLNGDGKVQRWEWGQSSYGQSVFICLKDYSQNTPGMAAASGLCGSITSGTKSAAQIINDIAKACNINPQVLLVLLNKEQSLVTDTWPLKQQYDGATGFDCPDTAPCDPNYAGFFYQVYYAARQFQIYKTQPNNFNYIAGRNNNIYWNPDLSRCGSSQVYIENQATAALYIYTPYQPNKAALDNMYGTGDSCSSYGNRNFWRMFVDWFGSTVDTGRDSIIRTYEDGAMYLRGANNSYYYIQNTEQLKALGYGISNIGIYNTSKSYLSNLTNAGILSTTVRFGSDANVYLLDSGNKQLYSYDTYIAHGSPQVSSLDPLLIGRFYSSSDVTTVIRKYGDSHLYSIQSGKRRYIGGPSVYTSGGYSSVHVTSLGNYNFSNIPEGAPLLSPGTLTRASDTGATGVISADGNSLIPVDSSAAKSLTFTPYSNTSSILNLIAPASNQPNITLLARDTSDNLYLLDGTKKYNVSLSQITTLGKSPTHFINVDQVFLDRFTTLSIPGDILLMRSINTDPIYVIENGEIVRIETLNDFKSSGFIMSSVIDTQPNTLSSLLINNLRTYLPSNALFRVGNSPTVYLTDKSRIPHIIPTGSIFDDFGFRYLNVRVVNEQTFNSTSQGEPLKNIVTAPDGSVWAISFSTRHWIDPVLMNDYSNNQGLTPISSQSLNSMYIGKNMTRFIRIGKDSVVYYVDSGKKTPLQSPQTFSNYGGKSWDEVVSVSSSFADMLQSQPVAQ